MGAPWPAVPRPGGSQGPLTFAVPNACCGRMPGIGSDESGRRRQAVPEPPGGRQGTRIVAISHLLDAGAEDAPQADRMVAATGIGSGKRPRSLWPASLEPYVPSHGSGLLVTHSQDRSQVGPNRSSWRVPNSTNGLWSQCSCEPQRSRYGYPDNYMPSTEGRHHPRTFATLLTSPPPPTTYATAAHHCRLRKLQLVRARGS